MLEYIKSWLKGKHITVPDDWILACLEFSQKSQMNITSSQENVINLVYDQWLKSDLEELGCSCWPDGIFDQSKALLNGFFAVQINSILDVSKSFYSQLQDVCGTLNENVAVTAKDTQTPEIKGKRFLMMKITDGTRTIQGMEYKPIPLLHVGCPPGIKVLLKGQMECRHNVLLLTARNVEILGGDSLNLCAVNTQEQLLRHCLDHPGDFRLQQPLQLHARQAVGASGGSHKIARNCTSRTDSSIRNVEAAILGVETEEISTSLHAPRDFASMECTDSDEEILANMDLPELRPLPQESHVRSERNPLTPLNTNVQLHSAEHGSSTHQQEVTDMLFDSDDEFLQDFLMTD